VNYMIFDNPLDKNVMEFISKSEYSIVTKYPEKKLSSVKEMWKYCKEILKMTKEDDTIIFWYDFLGILFWHLAKLKLKKRKVFVLNILLKNKKSLKNRFAKVLYKKALKGKDLKATVTSKDYGDYLNNFLHIKKNYYVLNDPCHFTECKQNINDNNYVFCGGRNGRDWEFMTELAKEMPDYDFHFILGTSDAKDYQNSFSKNVQVRTEVSPSEFDEELMNASLVAMPLNTEAPAGLLAFYQAAYYGKMIITSNTVTTRGYFTNDSGVLCEKDIEEWKTKIMTFMENKSERDRIGFNFQKYIMENCSEKEYLDKLEAFAFN